MLLGVLAQVDQAVAPFAPVPIDSPDVAEVKGEAAVSVQLAGKNGVTGEDIADPDLDMAMDADMGVAVSREEVMLSIEQDATGKPPAPLPAPPRPAGQLHPRSISLPINPPPKRKLPGQAALSRTEPPSKESSTNPDPTKPKKHARRNNHGFDNIFGSSGEEDTAPAPTTVTKKKKASKEPTDSTTGSPPPDKPRPQKKKKKTREDDGGGDEFDDIFGSLDGKSKKPKKKKRKKGDEFDDIFGGL
ncbi:uncharacterized protein B0H64DRAFT_397691 [Chaetomium fimeti]|uniref:Uncharacterized protein n=1 Tax=Chaetomium fimeti TaxID=1854472 RepID=A0AAE0HIH5_9PEZI|nr:hypothetical protein B0H64DRAFT_397691 [Chaetomium fimeti]